MFMDRSRSLVNSVQFGPTESVTSAAIIPSEAGVVCERGRYFIAFDDGTLLPYIAGGASETAPPVPKLLLKPEEGMEVLGVGKTTFFSLLKTGEIKSVRIGRARRVVAASLHDYVEARLADAQ